MQPNILSIVAISISVFSSCLIPIISIIMSRNWKYKDIKKEKIYSTYEALMSVIKKIPDKTPYQIKEYAKSQKINLDYTYDNILKITESIIKNYQKQENDYLICLLKENFKQYTEFQKAILDYNNKYQGMFEIYASKQIKEETKKLKSFINNAYIFYKNPEEDKKVIKENLINLIQKELGIKRK